MNAEIPKSEGLDPFGADVTVFVDGDWAVVSQGIVFRHAQSLKGSVLQHLNLVIGPSGDVVHPEIGDINIRSVRSSA